MDADQMNASLIPLQQHGAQAQAQMVEGELTLNAQDAEILGNELRAWVALTEMVDRVKDEEKMLRQDPRWVDVRERHERLVKEERAMKKAILENRIMPYGLFMTFELKRANFDVLCSCVKRPESKVRDLTMAQIEERFGPNHAKELEDIVKNVTEDVVTMKRVKKQKRKAAGSRQIQAAQQAQLLQQMEEAEAA